MEQQIRRRAPAGREDELLGLWRRLWWLPVKGWHATEFAILYALLRRAGLSKAESLALVAVGAGLDEFHQTFVKGRTGTPRDVLIDIGGAVTAAAIETQLERRS